MLGLVRRMAYVRPWIAIVAYQFFLGSCNSERSDKYRAALQTCSDASLGGKTTMAARRAVLAVAREAGILFDEKA